MMQAEQSSLMALALLVEPAEVQKLAVDEVV